MPSAKAALDQFFDFLRFGSVSTDPKHKGQVLECAAWVEKKLKAIGLDARQYETPGHQIVLARGPRKEGRPTVLIYGHYDVQPVDPVELWRRPASRRDRQAPCRPRWSRQASGPA